MLRTCFAAIMLFGCIGCGAGTEPTRPEKTFEEAYGEAKLDAEQLAKNGEAEERSGANKQVTAIKDKRFKPVAHEVWTRTPSVVRLAPSFIPLMMLQWGQAGEEYKRCAVAFFVDGTLKQKDFSFEQSEWLRAFAGDHALGNLGNKK